MTPLRYLFLSSLFVSITLNSFAYTAKWADKFGVGQTTFFSSELNNTKLDLSIQERQELCSGISVQDTCDYVKAQKYYSKRNIYFTCPGYSILYRVKSEFDAAAIDRKFSLGCVFFEDDKSNLIGVTERSSKHKSPDSTTIPPGWVKPGTFDLANQAGCNANPGSPLYDVNQPSGNNICMGLFFIPDKNFSNSKDYTFTCEARFNCGLVSRKIITNDPNVSRPRDFGNYCCTVKDFNSNLLVPQNCTDSPVFASGSSFDYQCPKDQAIHEIVTKFDPAKNDRSYQFKCCNLESGKAN